MDLPKEAHCALICGQTGYGKSVFALDMLENYYCGNFENIVSLCPTIKYNKTYKARKWVWTDKQIYIIDPGDNLNEVLKDFHEMLLGESTLFIIDDCSAKKEITKKKDTLSELAFSGRHVNHSVWIITQKYNSILKDFREQTQWVALFDCKDRDSFEDCLRANYVIKSKEEINRIEEILSQSKHAKLLLKTFPPKQYCVLA